MLYLLLVSLLWAFSFGLIKGNLTSLDPNLVSFVRIGISFIVFLPFIKIKNVNKQFIIKLMIVGAFQFGFMYLFYIYSYQYLQAYEVALFTIFTPVYVTLINDLLNKNFNSLFLITSSLAVLGTGIITYQDLSSEIINGFLIVQISNLCFAFGQIYYKKVMSENKLKDRDIFAYVYFGAVIITAIAALITTDFTTLQISDTQYFTILYLGVVASGLGFFLWNYGARRTNSGTLAVFNNLKIPLAIAVSIIVFRETGDTLRLTLGGGIVLGALILNEKFPNLLNKNAAE